MRVTSTLLILATCLGAVPLVAQEQTQADTSNVPLFLRKPTSPAEALKAYREKPYRPLRVGEVRAAPFLTDGEAMPFGVALGPTTPSEIPLNGSVAANEVGASFAIQPPKGASYQVGDTLTVARQRPGPRGWGDVVSPSGLLVVESTGTDQTVTRVAAVYGPITQGQVVYPTPSVVDPGEVQPTVTDGPGGTLIGPETVRPLVMPGSNMFIDIGRRDGLRVGDFVRIHRRAGQPTSAAFTIDAPIGLAQVVHVDDGTSTIRIIELSSPDMPAGSPVVRVATLPG